MAKRLLYNLLKSHRRIVTGFNCICTRQARLLYTGPRRPFVLGIETSCDDTGAAVIDREGNILGESLSSQLQFHLELGGITPPFARYLHEEKIAHVVQTTLESSNLEFKDIDAVATTVKPGLSLSLEVGLNYTKVMLQKHRIPFIPIHHMEAHALVARMFDDVKFPYLTLLISGGHCILAVVRDVDDFILLGETIDDAPGEVLDKVARRLKLKNIPECSQFNGGKGIEYLARKGDPSALEFPNPMWKHKHCQFSFSGLKFAAIKQIKIIEHRKKIKGDAIIPGIEDLCASFQNSIARHIFRKVLTGIAYIEANELIPNDEDKSFVVSGGVAANTYIRAAMKYLCLLTNYRLVCPPPKYCTDNGVMIAWNGMEKLRLGKGIVEKPESVKPEPKAKFADNRMKDLAQSGVKGTRLKFDVDRIHDIAKDMYSKSKS